MTEVSIVILSALSCFVSLYYIWLMQLNGYFFLRAYKSLIFNTFFLLSALFSIAQLLISLFWAKAALYSAIIFCAALTPFLFAKKKVPLIFTRRVIRWILILFVIYLSLNFFCDGYILPIVFLPITLFANILAMPIEQIVNAYYIKKAHNKLINSKCTVISIVGSYAKTSVKNILKAFLSTKYKVEASPNSFNTPLGLAKFINSIDLTQDMLVILEKGAKKVNDIKKLCKLYPPTHAIVTGITGQHLSTFKTLSNIIKAKSEIMNFLSTEGFCVLNADDINSSGCFLKGDAKKISVGKNGKDYAISDVSVGISGTSFLLTENANRYKVKTPLLSSINALNISLALALAHKLNCDIDKMLNVAAFLPYVPHRLELIVSHNGYIIDDSYNANTEGVKGLTEVLSTYKGKKIIVSQGIVELGVRAYEQNFILGEKLSEIADICYLTGINADAIADGLKKGKTEEHKIIKVNNINEAVKDMQKYVSENSVIVFQNDLPDNFKN